MLLQRKLNDGKERTHDTFFAGLFGGYLVFGERNAINEQVRLFSIVAAPHRCLQLFWGLMRAHPPFSAFFPADRAVRLFPRGGLVYTPRVPVNGQCYSKTRSP